MYFYIVTINKYEIKVCIYKVSEKTEKNCNQIIVPAQGQIFLRKVCIFCGPCTGTDG